VERRLNNGESVLGVLRRVAVRTVSLLVVGVLMVNSDGASEEGRLNPSVWALLMYSAVCLTWMDLRFLRPRGRRWCKVVGIVLLAAAALTFRGPAERSLLELRPYWWGILGLIGWAYLVSSLIYLASRRSSLVLAAAVSLLYCVYLADGAGFFPFGGHGGWVAVGSTLGAHGAIATSGTLLGLTLLSPTRSHRSRILSAVCLGAVLAAAAVLLHSLHGIHDMFIYNKNLATPPWCLLSSAWTAWLWAGLYWLVEVRGWRRPTRTLAAAGRHALFAFVAGPIAYSILGLLVRFFGAPDVWSRLGDSLSTGLWRSLAFAAGAIWVTAFLHRRGFTLKV
jgi:hypothetical protein